MVLRNFVVCYFDMELILQIISLTCAWSVKWFVRSAWISCFSMFPRYCAWYFFYSSLKFIQCTTRVMFKRYLVARFDPSPFIEYSHFSSRHFRSSNPTQREFSRRKSSRSTVSRRRQSYSTPRSTKRSDPDLPIGPLSSWSKFSTKRMKNTSQASERRKKKKRAKFYYKNLERSRTELVDGKTVNYATHEESKRFSPSVKLYEAKSTFLLCSMILFSRFQLKSLHYYVWNGTC